MEDTGPHDSVFAADPGGPRDAAGANLVLFYVLRGAVIGTTTVPS